MAYDNICRYLTSEHPAAFVQWLLGTDTTDIQTLPTELSLEPIRSDALFQIPDLNLILHLEFQTKPSSQPPLPVRMLDYWLRIYREYQCPIQQVVIFLKQTNSPAVYIDKLEVGNTTHQYRILRLWEQDPIPLLANPALLPLAVLGKTDSPSTLLQQVVARIGKVEDRELKQNIAACVEVLAGLKFNQELINQYIREEMMEESVTYQNILKRGKIDILFRQIKRRFGDVNSTIQTQIRDLSNNQIDDLSEELFDFSAISDLINWLNVQKQKSEEEVQPAIEN